MLNSSYPLGNHQSRQQNNDKYALTQFFFLQHKMQTKMTPCMHVTCMSVMYYIMYIRYMYIYIYV